MDKLSILDRSPAGVFTPAMAAAVGINAALLGRLRQSGAVVRVCGRGHMRGGSLPTLEQRAVAAALTWADSVTCLRTAARLYDFPVADDGRTHVLVPNGRRPFRGIAPHQWSVRPLGVVDHGTWRVTDRVTTLADCLAQLPEDEAWGVLAWMQTRDQLDVDALRSSLAERWHLYGVVRLRQMVTVLDRGAVSLAEVALLDFLVACGFVGWVSDERIVHNGRVVARADVLFVRERVILEYDGRAWHTPERAARDAERKRLLRSLGYLVIRVRWEQLAYRRHVLEREIRVALTTAA